VWGLKLERWRSEEMKLEWERPEYVSPARHLVDNASVADLETNQ
jgi:hypothetical protein